MRSLNYNQHETLIYLAGTSGFITIIRKHIKLFVYGRFFDSFIMFCVVLNTLILAADGLLPDSSAELMKQLNLTFTISFVIDMSLKLLG